MSEKKIFCIYIYLLRRITLYQSRWKTTSLNKIEFLDTYVCINNPHWQSSGIIILLWKYYIIISDTLVDSFLEVLFLLPTVILSEVHVKLKSFFFFAFFVYTLNLAMSSIAMILCDDIMGEWLKIWKSLAI